jgi:uncharacterized membrane protein HdeD (DUF308 family)
MSKALIIVVGLVLFSAIAFGLWDVFRGASLLTGAIALMFVAAGVFNTWAVLNRRS